LLHSPALSDFSHFRLCSTCKKPIGFEAEYFQCSVSTCNRLRVALFFCSLACWDAHLPMMRHREAWAEPMKSPTREAWQREQERQEAENTESTEMNEPADKSRRVVQASTSDVAREILVVVSKLKAYIRARSGMNTSEGVAEVLSDELRKRCDAAIENATRSGRKTVLDRDFSSRSE
jgi:hypothetical protein